MSAKEALKVLVDKMNQKPEHLEGQKDRVIQAELSDSGVIQLVLQDKQAKILESDFLEPDVTLILSDKNFIKLLNDDLNAMMAFMTGSLKIQGNTGLALKLQELIKKYQE